jgi:thiol-disulfide isomerase/thioredoxin
MKKLVLQLTVLVVLVMLPFLASGIGSQGLIDFEARDIHGNRIKLSDYNDRVVVLDFWATWCGPCRREIPHLINLKKEFNNPNKFEIISVNGFERRSDQAAIKFVKEKKMNWVHIIDKKVGYDISEKYRVQFIPTVYVIDKGKIVASNLKGAALKQKIKELVR